MKICALLIAMSFFAGATGRADTANETPAALPEAQSLIEVVAAADAIVAAFGRHDPKAYLRYRFARQPSAATGKPAAQAGNRHMITLASSREPKPSSISETASSCTVIFMG